MRGIDFSAALRWLADYLHVEQEDAVGGDDERRIVAVYGFCDARGELSYQVVRFDPKDFRLRRPDGKGGWIWNMRGIQPLPYRLPQILAADPERPVVIVEGEKDADNLAALGVIATTNHGGAGKWTPAHAAHLTNRHVVIVPDADGPGERHAHAVAASLQGIAASVRLVRLPTGKDASDWLQAGGTPEQLRELAAVAPAWTPTPASVVGSATIAPWPELDRLDDRTLPDFPAHVLPATLRDWVAAESHATQTPADLAGLLALAICSSCIAGHVELEPHDGWRELVNLYVAILLAPGNRKSAVFADATRPLREVEKQLIDAARPAVAREQSERRQTQKRLDRCERMAAERGDAKSAAEAQQLAERLAGWPEPVLPRLIVDDVTGEKLAMLLAEQGGRLASLSPEGSVFDVMAGRYSKNGAADFDVYLKGHAGDELRTDRVSRKGVYIQRPTLTCGYAIQPQVIAGIAGDATFRGRGLLARFLYAAPQSWIGSRIIRPQPVPQATADAYAALVRQLATTPPQGTLTLRPDAAALFEHWQGEVEVMLAEGGQLEAIRDWGGKLAGATARLAAVLHCVKYHSLAAMYEIEPDSIQAALEIGRYLIPHAEAVLTIMHADGRTVADDARYLLRWIIRHGRREFQKRDAHQDGKRRFLRAEDIDPALAELVRRGYIRRKPQDVGGRGRSPSPAYDVNPAVFENTTMRCPWCSSQRLLDGTSGLWCCICERLAWQPTDTGGLVRCDAASVQIIDIPTPCPTCQGIAFWWDAAGGSHCETCSPSKLAGATSRHRPKTQAPRNPGTLRLQGLPSLTAKNDRQENAG